MYLPLCFTENPNAMIGGCSEKPSGASDKRAGWSPHASHSPVNNLPILKVGLEESRRLAQEKLSRLESFICCSLGGHQCSMSSYSQEGHIQDFILECGVHRGWGGGWFSGGSREKPSLECSFASRIQWFKEGREKPTLDHP